MRLPRKPPKPPNHRELAEKLFTAAEPTFEERKRARFEDLPSGLRVIAEQAEKLTRLYGFDE